MRSYLLFLFFILQSLCFALEHRFENQLFLEQTPEYFWDKNKSVFHWRQGQQPIITKGAYQTKGWAGIIPYALYQGNIYILLSRETWGVDGLTYCGLGGGIEAYGEKDEMPHIDSFLFTLLKEAREESGSLYQFSEDTVLDHAYVIAHDHQTRGYYEGYKSIIAFCRVDQIYFTDQFLEASKYHAFELEQAGLCPWAYQEKDDYQWILLSSFHSFLQESECNEGVFENIFGEFVKLPIRRHLIEILRSQDALEEIFSSV